MACLGRFTIQLVDDEITCLPLSRTMKLRFAGNSIYPSVHFPWLAVFGIGALKEHDAMGNGRNVKRAVGASNLFLVEVYNERHTLYWLSSDRLCPPPLPRAIECD